jgi:hypothetical protein
MEQIDLGDLPVLPGQMIPPMAAIALRRKRQRIDQMMREGKIKTATRVPGTEGRVAAYVIREAEVRKLAVANCPSCQWRIEHGAVVASCDHFIVGADGQVALADIPQVTEAEEVEHAVPFAASGEPAQV